MKCAFIKQHGEAIENLVVDKRPDLTATGENIRIKVAATALNRADLQQRRGHYPPPPGTPKHAVDIPGLEFAGVIDQIGNRVTRWHGGERVFGIVPAGGYASQVVTHQDLVVQVPDNVSDESAAAIPEAFMTAFDALILQCGLAKGERVLIHAVASGVGTAAVQLAGQWQAEAVGTAGSRYKIGKVTDIAGFLGINYRESDFQQEVEARYGENAIDVILDVVGAKYWERNIALLAPRGRLIIVGRLGGSEARMDLAPIMMKRLRIMGTVMRSRSHDERAALARAFEQQVVPLFRLERLNSVIDAVYPFEEIHRATARMENNENVGKIVLTFD